MDDQRRYEIDKDEFRRTLGVFCTDVADVTGLDRGSPTGSTVQPLVAFPFVAAACRPVSRRNEEYSEEFPSFAALQIQYFVARPSSPAHTMRRREAPSFSRLALAPASPRRCDYPCHTRGETRDRRPLVRGWPDRRATPLKERAEFSVFLRGAFISIPLWRMADEQE